MSFDVAADAYARFMGRYSEPLAIEFAETLAVRPGSTAIDVGCGPGALTAELVRRLGTDAVAAVDPSESFVEAARERLPGVDIRLASAEALPFASDSVDLAVAQLVVHFMADPMQGLSEMARVTKRGGRVAANVWDHAGEQGPLAAFWRAARDLDPGVRDESGLAGAREGHLAELFEAAGLHDIQAFPLTVQAGYSDFETWWTTFTLGVGPAGEYVKSLDEPRREALRRHCQELLPADGPFEITAVAWTAVGTVE
jgi:SAM-dependent methyltransferase